jgi:8-oxo-dGTP diphosphatase
LVLVILIYDKAAIKLGEQLKMAQPKYSELVSDLCVITPHDDLETQHIQETLLWIESGAPLFRVQKPDIPNKHLVSYFVLFDEAHKKILLVDHKKALLWLPSGGHVEIDEDPQQTVVRECREELGIEADFWLSDPFF